MTIDPRLAAVADQQPYPLVFATVSGAHLYGFESADSDWDLRGVHVLPLPEVVGLVTGPETITVSSDDGGLDLDLVTHDIRKFCALLLKPNGYVLEQLHSPLVIAGGDSHDELRDLSQGCITSRHAHHYLGFADTQWQLFEKTGSQGLKPLLYVFRVLKTGIRLMRTSEVEANLTNLLNDDPVIEYLPELIDAKKSGGEHATIDGTGVDRYRQDIDHLREVLQYEQSTTKLATEPTARAALNDFVIRTRLATRERR